MFKAISEKILISIISKNLFQPVKILTRLYKGGTALIAASKYEHIDIVQLLILYGADSINITDSSVFFNYDVLLESKEIQFYQKISSTLPLSFMIKNFFILTSLSYYGYNSLYFAIMQESTNNLKRLLKGSNINVFINSYDNKDKQTRLGFALNLNKFEHAKVLISFLTSPIYFKYSLLSAIVGDYKINVLDIPEIKEYVPNRMIFDVLKDGRPEYAWRLLSGHVQAKLKLDDSPKKDNVLADLETEMTNFSYKEIIN